MLHQVSSSRAADPQISRLCPAGPSRTFCAAATSTRISQSSWVRGAARMAPHAVVHRIFCSRLGILRASHLEVSSYNIFAAKYACHNSWTTQDVTFDDQFHSPTPVRPQTLGQNARVLPEHCNIGKAGHTSLAYANYDSHTRNLESPRHLHHG